MRLKTFIATYLLFLFILFSSVAFVSVYLTNSQINMLKDKSASQFQAIVHALGRDVAVTWGRNEWNHDDFSVAVSGLVRDYARYYSRHNIYLSVTDLQVTGQDKNSVTEELIFINQKDGHYIIVSGLLPEPFGYFLLEYRFDITGNISEMRGIQNVLLISAAVFALIAAFALFFILSAIFKPLNIVAQASREIANGKFDERIRIKGNNELTQVAYDFNKMAERIESHIIYLEEEAENKQEFVDNFAHEIRTPLTSIYGYAEYMHKASLDEKEIIESTAYIMDEASHMRNIANSLLELAILRHYVPIVNAISIPKLFNDVAQTMEQPLHEKGVQLICHNEIEWLYGQEDLIKSLLLNLCTNALKACNPHEGIIHLEAEEQSDGMVILVTDNGCGIPKKSLPRLAEPFYRVDKSRSRDFGGTGLGMALCKQIVEVHSARMVIQSVLGEGTTIAVKFTTS